MLFSVFHVHGAQDLARGSSPRNECRRDAPLPGLHGSSMPGCVVVGWRRSRGARRPERRAECVAIDSARDRAAQRPGGLPRARRHRRATVLQRVPPGRLGCTGRRSSALGQAIKVRSGRATTGAAPSRFRKRRPCVTTAPSEKHGVRSRNPFGPAGAETHALGGFRGGAKRRGTASLLLLRRTLTTASPARTSRRGFFRSGE